jgi:isocitrate lyase
MNHPFYVDPAVLVPGTTVVAVLDSSQTPLVVLRVEPLIVCRTPAGEEVTVFAHEVVTVDDGS